MLVKEATLHYAVGCLKHQISRCLEAKILEVKVIVSPTYLTGPLAVLLPRHLSNVRAISQFSIRNSWRWGFLKRRHFTEGLESLQWNTRRLGIQISHAMMQCKVHHINGLEQNCSNSRTLSMELLQSFTKPSLYPILLNTYPSGFHHSQQWFDAKYTNID